MSDKSVIIHVRFFNDGTVLEIGERPAGLSSQEWFTKLTNAYAMDFMALSGGRGAFKLTPEELEVAKSATLQ